MARPSIPLKPTRSILLRVGLNGAPEGFAQVPEHGFGGCIVEMYAIVFSSLKKRAMSTVSDELISLWDSLHDGSLESLSSDTLDRSTTLVVDVPISGRSIPFRIQHDSAYPRGG